MAFRRLSLEESCSVSKISSGLRDSSQGSWMPVTLVISPTRAFL